MQSLSGYSWRQYSQIPGVQRSSEEWGTGRNLTLQDHIYGLHLALRVTEQRCQNYEPNQYKSVISRMPYLFFRADQQNYAQFLTYYRHLMKHIEKMRPGSEKLLSDSVISVLI